MANVDEVNGVDVDSVVKVNGVAVANIDEFLGNDWPQGASQWFVGTTQGRILTTTVPIGTDTWSEMVDVGGSTQYSFTDLAMGEDASGNLRLMAQASTNGGEIHFANVADDLTDSSSWTSQNLNIDPWGNPKGADHGPGLAFGNGVWMAVGLNGATGESPTDYEALIRSTDGGANWS